MFNIFVKAHKEEMASVIRGPARLGVGKCFDFLSGKKKNNSKFDPCQTLWPLPGFLTESAVTVSANSQRNLRSQGTLDTHVLEKLNNDLRFHRAWMKHENTPHR